MTIDLPTLKCKRCGHTWNPRNPVIPKVCPKCKTPYWATDRKVAINGKKETGGNQ